MAKNIVLILGGARSGKSAFAEKLARESGRPVTYIATADVRDEEMERRVEHHKLRRPAEWDTWEGMPERLPDAIRSMDGVLLLDCLTLWLTRLFLETDAETLDETEWSAREDEIRQLTERLCEAPRDNAKLIIVSNEVGFGLVPMTLTGRRFRDLQGRMNQLVASRARGVALVAAGCPLWIKQEGNGEIANE